MAGSAAEREIRDAVIARLRRDLPNARVVHELKVGGGTNRADLAAVEPSRLLLFELKSDRDELKRARKQMGSFLSHSHGAVLVLHEKWFDRTPYNNGAPRCVAPDICEWNSRQVIWCYPEGAAAGTATAASYSWRLPRPSLWQPHPRAFLGLLWRQELVNVAAMHRVAIGRRANMEDITDHLAWQLTGREICKAVCGQLRQRPFAEADGPMFEEAAA